MVNNDMLGYGSKVISFVVLFTLSNVFSFAQKQTSACKAYYDALLKMTVYTDVDKMPSYMGGDFLQSLNVSMSEHEIDENAGKVRLVVIIDANGKVVHAQIENRSVDQLTPFEHRLITAAKNSPSWSPGVCGGKKVPVKLSFPLFVCTRQ